MRRRRVMAQIVARSPPDQRVRRNWCSVWVELRSGVGLYCAGFLAADHGDDDP
jgi:hypothetical protein